MNNEKPIVKNVRELIVYRLAFKTAMEIYKITKSFPTDERYSLTDQVRRSSRAVCSNLAEGWYKRRYVAVFINKLTDSMQEAAETQTWLEFSFECGYISGEQFHYLLSQYEHVIAKLMTMERKSILFCGKPHPA